MSTPQPFDPTTFDAAAIDALAVDLNALRARLKASVGVADVAHQRRIVIIGRLCMVLGIATAGWGVNPVSVVALSMAMFIRWAGVVHPVSHRAMDGLPGSMWHSKRFARGGLRRVVDWLDWVPVEGWSVEHNQFHHSYTGELRDPDQPERNTVWLRAWPVPRALKVLLVLVGSVVWKPLYYGPNAVNALFDTQAQRRGERPSHIFQRGIWDPRQAAARAVWIRAWLPVLLGRYGVLPLLFLPFGQAAWLAALVNIALADALSNVHSFWVIVPNHVGSDVYRFDDAPGGRAEWYLQQIVGTANYRTGGAFNDLMHGYLNYQIEHHLWPELPLLQLERAQPEVEAICARHGVPYLQESLFTRARKCVQVLTGAAQMPHWPVARAAAPAGAPLDHPARAA